LDTEKLLSFRDAREREPARGYVVRLEFKTAKKLQH